VPWAGLGLRADAVRDALGDVTLLTLPLAQLVAAICRAGAQTQAGAGPEEGAAAVERGGTGGVLGKRKSDGIARREGATATVTATATAGVAAAVAVAPLPALPAEAVDAVVVASRHGTATWRRSASVAAVPPPAVATSASAHTSGGADAPGALAVAWSARLARCVDASPLVVTYHSPTTSDTAPVWPTVFIGSHGGDVHALDGHTGSTLWTTTLTLGGRAAHVEGSAAAAAGAAAVVYVGAYRGDDVDGPRAHGSDGGAEEGGGSASTQGGLFCLCAATGALRWQCPLPGEVKATPLVVPTVPYAATDPWSAPDAPVGTAGLGPCETAFIAVGAYDGRLHLVGPCGTARASVDVGGSIYAAPTLLSHAVASAAAGVAAVVVVCTTRGAVVAVTCSAGGVTADILWTHDAGAPVFSTPLVCGDRVVFGTVDGTVRCLRTTATRAEESWRNTDAARPVFSSPALVRIGAAGAGSSSSSSGGGGGAWCVYGAHDGVLRGVSLATGAAVFSIDLGCVLFASPAVVSQRDLGKGGRGVRLVAATTAGDVHLLLLREAAGGGHDGEEGKKEGEVAAEVVASVKLAGEVYSSPVMVGGGRDVYIGCRDDCCHRIALPL